MGTKKNRNQIPAPERPSGGIDSENRVDVRFRGKRLLVNKVLTDEELDRLEKVIPQDETVRFVVVGDLNVKSK